MESWRRNQLAVWTSLFATSMGLMAFLPELTVYVGERFHIEDPAELTLWGGMIYGTAPISAAIAGPVWGALGDRRGKKPMAIRANVAIALTTALMPFCSTPLWLLLFRAIQGVLAGYVAPAMSLVSADAPPERQGRVIARLQVAMALGSFAGPLFGSEVAWAVVHGLPEGVEPWWGRASLFWVTSVLSALSALLLWWFAVEAPRRAAPDAPSFGRDLWQSCKRLLQQRVFARLLLLVLALRLGQNMLEPFVALFVRELGPQAWIAAHTPNREQALSRTTNVAFWVLALSQLLFTPMWGRLADRFGPLRCLASLGCLLGAVQVATSFVTGIDQFLGLRTLAACFMAGSMTLAYAAATKRVLLENRTLAFSMVQSCMQLGFGCGGLLGSGIAGIGASAEHANLRLSFVAAGALCIAAGIGMFLLRRLSVQERRRQPVAGAPTGGDRGATGTSGSG